MRRAITMILAAALLFLAAPALGDGETEDYGTLYVTADVLNGRVWPSKKAHIAAIFDYGDLLEPTGQMSRDSQWVEVIGGESGTVWVNLRYVTERMLPFEVTNENNGRVKIRSRPGGGKLKGYIGRGKSVLIDRVVLGWGHCSKGWVDLEYFIEVV